MDFDLSKAQKLLQQSARDFFARECKPERVRELMATETAYDAELWQAMADQGFTGLTIPEEYGGLGLSLVDLIAVAEEMGRACLPGPFLSTLWAATLIECSGNEGQRIQFLKAFWLVLKGALELNRHWRGVPFQVASLIEHEIEHASNEGQLNQSLKAIRLEMERTGLGEHFFSTLNRASLNEHAGNEGRRIQYLRAISAGEMKATVALLEASANWDPDAVKMRAEKDGKEYRLRGAKHFVTDAAVADVIVCVARDGYEFVMLPVERGAAGLKITATPGIDMTRKLYTVEFNNVVVPESSALALTTKTKEALEAATDVATVALCAEMLGGMQWTLENTVEYAKTRQQFGKPIGIYQAVQHQCADMFNYAESARSAVYYAAWAVSENDPSAKLAVSVAKGFASDAAREVGNRGVQIHGGIGFTWEHNIQLYYKRAKASEIMFGDANYHREEIARKVVDESEG